MRKFIDKHRQKRKYTRKHHTPHSLSVSKEFFVGFVPILLIGLALTVSLAFMQLLRDQNISLQISRNLPTITFDWLTPYLALIPQTVSYLITFLNPQPLLAFLWDSAVSYAFFSARLVDNFVVYNYLLQAFVANSFYSFVQHVLNFSANSAYVTIHTLGVVVQAIMHWVVTTSLFVAHTFIVTIHATWKFLLLMITKFVAFIDQVIYVLGTPFRILGAFYLQIKPYLDYFMSHVQMTGSDFNQGVKSMTNFGGIINGH